MTELDNILADTDIPLFGGINGDNFESYTDDNGD